MKEKYGKKNLEKIIKRSYTFADIKRELGLTLTGNNNDTLKKYIKEYEINISHFDPYKVRREKLIKHNTIPLNRILIENSTYTNTSHLKERLYKEGLKEHKCELCGQGEEWKGKKMSLILDHKNGINNDNRIENLRIVCPNCNATLDTHCGKLSNEERNIRKKNRIIKNQKTIINASKKRRKVKRPDYDELLNNIETNGYSATGRKYGVSDNAIRRWVSFYVKYELPR